MIRTRDEILEEFRGIMGDEPTDAMVTLLEDLTDTINQDVDQLTAQVAQLTQQVADTDASWRKRYTDRFFDGKAPDPEPETPDPDDDPGEGVTLDDILKKEAD